ncbi:hypothetical protein TI05_14645 [Achromatium sp. WMS3]|nr:hypothetical protein TI05_14645 [Achromatium sp. WMS3]
MEDRLAYCNNHLDTTATAKLPNQLLKRCQEPELRLAVLPKVTDSQALVECTLQDTVAAVRLAAIELLNDKSSLEQVVREIGKKDKGVYRIARQRLKDITEQEKAPIRLREEATNLCTKMERLAKRNLWSQDKSLIESYIEKWEALEGTIPADLTARFQTANTVFQQGYQSYQDECKARAETEAAHARLHAARHKLLVELENLVNTEIAAEDTNTDEAKDTDEDTAFTKLTERLNVLNQRWLALDQETPAPSKIQEKYAHLEQQLFEKTKHLQVVHENCQRLKKQLEQGQIWLDQSESLDAQTLRDWRKIGNHLTTNCTDKIAILQYQDLLEKLQHRIEQQKKQATDRLKQLSARIDTLEKELETGILRRASGLYQSIQSDLAFIKSSDVGQRRYEMFEQRMHRLTPQLRELQSWRKWGNHQHRLDMCETLEKLANSTEEISLSLLAERVQALQAEWKRLDRDGARASEALWQRFHKVADQVYAKCRSYSNLPLFLQAFNLLNSVGQIFMCN